MPRIEPAFELTDSALDGLDPQGRIEREVDAIYAHRPALADAKTTLMRSFGSEGTGTLPPRLLELVRLRIAFWNQCRSCMSMRHAPDAVDEGLVCSLERPAEADDLSAAEKSALGFADLMATDHLAIDEDVYDDLRLHFTEAELVELGLFCAAAIGLGRLSATWAMHENLHERFRGEGDDGLTPWGDGALR